MLPLAVALLAGCGSASSLLTPSAGVPSTSPPSGGPPWIVVAQGKPTPSPTPSYRAPAPSPVATGFLPLPSATPVPTNGQTCEPRTYDFSRIDALDVTTGTTDAVATWYNIGGYNLVEFRLTAISQDLRVGRQRDYGFVTIQPASPCGKMTGRITGLTPKTGYVFSIDAVVQRRSGDGTHAATVYRSPPIRTK
ncbi:hypothetical protein EV385_0822 [Krasilnikovia cinnamomea]|uniref:Fibronectin type-III domain-containing protein n=1 Tax=Krasilnikovia cinnamomea TaxID=349313 RepID=A0A4Q7ZEG8_9ACTN|nr:hypothetical protein [Krasilnikovia cinnamomea]RZU49087.1 hypothetical protein EV385_0822 [Krasilnikovia cinnamomea]